MSLAVTTAVCRKLNSQIVTYVTGPPTRHSLIYRGEPAQILVPLTKRKLEAEKRIGGLIMPEDTDLVLIVGLFIGYLALAVVLFGRFVSEEDPSDP
jgi:hypothetical protein